MSQGWMCAPYNDPDVSCPAQTWPAKEDYETLLAYVLQGMTLQAHDLWYMTCQDHNQQQACAFVA